MTSKRHLLLSLSSLLSGDAQWLLPGAFSGGNACWPSHPPWVSVGSARIRSAAAVLPTCVAWAMGASHVRAPSAALSVLLSLSPPPIPGITKTGHNTVLIPVILPLKSQYPVFAVLYTCTQSTWGLQAAPEVICKTCSRNGVTE